MSVAEQRRNGCNKLPVIRRLSHEITPICDRILHTMNALVVGFIDGRNQYLLRFLFFAYYCPLPFSFVWMFFYGLRVPDHEILESHPNLNQHI